MANVTIQPISRLLVANRGEIAARIVPVDAPGSTSANLRSLPFTQVPRPIYPLDTDLIPDLTAELKS